MLTRLHGTMNLDSSGRREIRDGILRLFPDTGEAILALASGAEDIPEKDASEVLSDLRGGFHVPDARGRPLALDYRSSYTDPVRFSDYCHDLDLRPRMDVVLLTTESGEPRGILPLHEGSGMNDVCDALKGFEGTIVTDRIGYTDGNVRALDRWGTDWLLTEPPFPYTAPAVRTRMSRLTHGGREYETCKVRYDRHWLFRFTDLAERDRLVSLIPSKVDDRRDADRLVKAAGITDALSSQSFDIRRVRGLMDARSACDGMMRDLWRGIDPSVDRDTAFAKLCVQLLTVMLR